MARAGLGLKDPQWGVVGGREGLEVAREVLGLARVPLVGTLAVGACHAVAGDEGAVWDHVAHTLLLALVQNPVQVRALVGQDVDGLVQVAVTGGLGDARIAGQAAHASGFTEPAQGEERLAERAQGGVSPAGCRSCGGGRPRARSSTTWRGTSSMAE